MSGIEQREKGAGRMVAERLVFQANFGELYRVVAG
jgi:hypothetical protein